MTSSISYNLNTRCFFLRLLNSFYALRILANGEVVHVSSGVLSELPATDDDLPLPSLLDLDSYEDANFAWEQQARRWELPAFGDITYHDCAVKANVVTPEEGEEPIRDLRLRYVNYEIRMDSEPGLSTDECHLNNPARETLRLHLRDEFFNIHVFLNYRLTPEHDIIERWLEIENHSQCSLIIDSLAFGTVHFPEGRYELMRPSGTWAREFVPVKQTLEQGKTVIDSSGLNTGHSTNPFYLLSKVDSATEESGEVFFGALAYSGSWGFRFEVLPTGPVRVHGGYDPSDFSLAVQPGDSHTTPAFVHGCAVDGRGGASRRLHRFIRQYVLPEPRHGKYRPVLYNSWEAVYFEMSFESQMELARKAAAIGIELFCVDDGWFGGRRSDNAGLGDWWVSPQVFPGGLTPLIDEVKQLGMRFGLWVEPEMVNPDSDLYRANPDWVLHFPHRPRTEVRNQLILDFGRPEVVEYIWSSLDRLVQDLDITFFKWDMNRYAIEPGSPAGQSIWLRHVEGVYSIMDRLRAAHPHLEIQSCSGGGGRVDLGILQRTDQVWTSDNTDAIDRVPIQEGFSLAYPPRIMESWVTHEVNHQTGRRTSLELRFDTAMRGALGIGTSLNKLSQDELNSYSQKISFYKKIRPIVQDGDLHRLESTEYVSTWLMTAADRRSAVYSTIVTGQPQGIFRAPNRLPGLIPTGMYDAVDETGTVVGQWSGFQLATIGLPGDTRAGGGGCAIRSRTLLLERAD